MASICLNMIVKNESRIIRRCFDSVKPFIDYWVIVDTGSTDDSRDIIRSFAAEVAGELHERPWINFGHNRTEALQLADGKADYVLLMDADNILEIDDVSAKRGLDADGYLIQIRGGVHYWIPRLVKSGLGWHSVGVTHEFMHSAQARPSQRLEAARVIDQYDGGAKADKYERDIRLLTQGLKDEPGNDRYMFYLAQSYRDLGDTDSAIEWYQTRADAGGWQEEVWLSLNNIGQLHVRKGSDESIVLKSFLAAYEYDPKRCEPLYELCRYYRTRSEHHKGVLFGQRAISIRYPAHVVNFVVEAIYDWMRFDELSICEYWTGDYTASAEHARYCLAQPGVVGGDRERIEANLKFATDRLGG